MLSGHSQSCPEHLSIILPSEIEGQNKSEVSHIDEQHERVDSPDRVIAHESNVEPVTVGTDGCHGDVKSDFKITESKHSCKNIT